MKKPKFERSAAAVKNNITRFLFYSIILLIISAFLYALAFPNPVFELGIPAAAWVAYTGVFFAIARARLWQTPLLGFFFGALSVTLHNYWLSYFHPLAGIIAAVLFAVYYAAFFFTLKCAAKLFPRWGFIIQWALWTGFEYIRTMGFLGYSYGIIAYSQWTVLPLIKAAGIAGVWIISALILFPQAFLGNLLAGLTEFIKQKTEKRFLLPFIPVFIWAAALILALFYGFTSKTDYSTARKVKIALLQPNSDPWKSNVNEFRKELETLQQLSDIALSEVPPPDIIVWPETAFVPSIYYHERYREDASSWLLVRDAQEYFASKNIPFVIGNNEGRRVYGLDGKETTVSYNAALLFDKGKNAGHYYKTKLVPFTEYFPYKEQFPSFYNILLKADTHFWEPGVQPVVFNAAGVKFSTPICFEDTFGSITREFAKYGAEIFVNISNDSWSHSITAQYQHLSAAVFRAVETGRAVVRSTVSGQTCAISPDGAILAMAEPLLQTTISVEVPVLDKTTFYTHFGDWLPITLLVFSALGFLVGGVIRIFNITRITRSSL
ncbi:MAG: apolipoprotein N-acyltransferase [Spirochaetaceae bacterium]|nr:apolipoprotein N-acyltransferase [Spirochaetaceae bacterium]